MKKFFFVPLIIGLGLLQAGWLGVLSVFGVKPDLLLIMAVMVSLFPFALGWALPLSSLAGITKDILSAGSLGINTLLFPLLGLLVARLSRKIETDNEIVRTSFVFVAAGLNGLANGLLLFSRVGFFLPGIFLRTLLLESFYTALVSPLAFRLIKPQNYF